MALLNFGKGQDSWRCVDTWDPFSAFTAGSRHSKGIVKMNPEADGEVGSPKLSSLHASLDDFGLEFLSFKTPTKATLESL